MSVPRLYAANEAVKENAFQTLGIGALGDAISCTVTEERNGEFELEMEYPVDGRRFKDLANDMLIVAKASDRGNEQIFRIYKIEKPIDGKVTISAEHISYLLNKAICLPFTTESATVEEAFTKLKENTLWQADNTNFPTFPFTYWTDNSDTGSVVVEDPKGVRTVLGGEDGSILDAIGGEYEFDNFTVKLWKNRGSDSNVYLRYGKNITDLTATNDISGAYTGIVPYWKGNLTKATTDSDGNATTESVETIVYLDDKVMWSEDGTKAYAYPMAETVDFSSNIEVEDDTSDKDNPVYATEDDVRTQLKTLAEDYLKNNKIYEPSDNIEVSFAQLWQTEEYEGVAALQRVGLCDTVHVVYPVLGITVSMEVIKTEYNVLLERYDSMELGEAKSSMSSAVVSNESSTTSQITTLTAKVESGLKKAFQQASQMILGKINSLAGANGGYVVFDTNAAGNIERILIMDTPDKSTATNVWCWSSGGLGHSHSGFNGPYDDIAITQDGCIVANRIVTGTLEDGAGNFSLNMQTGDLVMKNGIYKGKIECGRENHVADEDGTGVYIDYDGLSVGVGYNNYPIFSVSQTNGASSPVRTTGLGFRHTDGSDFGYFYAWGTKNADGSSINGNHPLDGGRGRGVIFTSDQQVDLGVIGRIYGNGISSAGSLYAHDCLYVYGSGESSIGHVNGANVILGYETNEGGAMLRVNNDGLTVKGGLNMTGFGITRCGTIEYESDERLKKDIEDIPAEDSKRVINALEPKQYRFKTHDEKKRFGFIAQEVQKISGREDLVGESDDYLNLNYVDLIADLVNVVKDQEKRIAALEEKLNGKC